MIPIFHGGQRSFEVNRSHSLKNWKHNSSNKSCLKIQKSFEANCKLQSKCCRSLWKVGLNYIGTCQSILPDPCKAVRSVLVQNVGNRVCKVSSHINWQGITKDYRPNTQFVCKMGRPNGIALLKPISSPAVECYSQYCCHGKITSLKVIHS